MLIITASGCARDGSIVEMFDVVYRNARGRLAELARALSAEQLRTPVAATPAWTVHELFAHLVRGAADVASGRLDGLPGDDWTARHVSERRHRSISELLAEWDLVGARAQASCVGEVDRWLELDAGTGGEGAALRCVRSARRRSTHPCHLSEA